MINPALTPAEQAAHELHIRGMSQHSIALALNIGRRTVRDRLASAYQKLEEDTSTSAEPTPSTNSAATKPKYSPTSSEITTPTTPNSRPTETATPKPVLPNSAAYPSKPKASEEPAPAPTPQ